MRLHAAASYARIHARCNQRSTLITHEKMCLCAVAMARAAGRWELRATHHDGLRAGFDLRTKVRRHRAGIHVEVQDEGPGLTEEDQRRVFGTFARLSAKPTGGEKSTGLGLSIATRLVEALNGRIWCTSESGKGAKFGVAFPLADQTQPS